MDYKYYLFDLDGTLTDSFPGITNSIIYTLSYFGIEVSDKNSLRAFIGPPLVDSFMKYYNFTAADANIALDKYREYFSDKGLFENSVYDGIPRLLNDLKKSGKSIMTATSKPTFYTVKILKHFDLFDYFDFIGGAELDGTRNDKPEIIKYVLQSNSITELNKVLMIGDRRNDILGAKENNIQSLGVLYGYGTSEELRHAGADFIASTVSELHDMLTHR